MPLAKGDNPKADKASTTSEPPAEEEKVVPVKGDASYDTPSGYALAKAGDDPDKYAAEKARKRWGY